jgi:nucleoside phosphorylase
MRLRRDEYTVGWICALPVELAAAQAMLDEKHDDLEHNENLYTLGLIGGHKVVIGSLPAGWIGTNPAAVMATQMRATFKGIRFGLMVGIGGGVPSAEVDIRLGDVVVSQPHQTSGGVIQYDLGKATPSGFIRTGSLNSPPRILLAAVARVQAQEFSGESKLSEHVSKLSHKSKFQHYMTVPDVLFEATYDHQGGQTCDLCNTDKQEARQPREGDEVVVHYGTIASGNQVMKYGRTRDMLSRELGGILCFEMEAAGLMNSFPCLVIRGICDYADSHKNKKWQPYAAVTAAAYAKEVLLAIPPEDVAETRTVETTVPKRFCITAISRKEELIDLFLCGPKGHVYTLWWLEGTGWSSDCTDVGGDFPPGARVTVVSRDGQKLDIFVCDINGRIFTSWWHVSDIIAFLFKWPMWSSWGKVGEQFPGGTEVAGIWSGRKSLDLFACAGDGQIHTLKWTNESKWSRNTQGDPLPRESPGFPTGAHVTVTARTEHHMDLFVCDSVGNVKTLGWSSLTGWSDWKLIGQQFLADVAAIVPTEDIIELFACQLNGRIYTTKWTTDSGWEPTWDCISSNTSFRVESTVVVTRLSSEIFQLFIHGSDGFIHTCWRSGPLAEWSTWKPINKQKFSGSVDVTAVVRMGARAVDVFVSNNEVRGPTIWWTRGSVFSWEEWRILPFKNVFKSD